MLVASLADSVLAHQLGLVPSAPDVGTEGGVLVMRDMRVEIFLTEVDIMERSGGGVAAGVAG